MASRWVPYGPFNTLIVGCIHLLGLGKLDLEILGRSSLLCLNLASDELSHDNFFVELKLMSTLSLAKGYVRAFPP